MRPIKIHVSDRLYGYAQRHAEALGIDVETFLTTELLLAFNEGALPEQQGDDDDDDFPFVTDPGGGVWHKDDLPADLDLADLMEPPDEEEEALMRDLMGQAAKQRRLH